ncbi:3'-5' exonuclease [Chondromyces apiculatus]|uniref:Exonuclease n=1 Tax=Chondromyces apiculatus DSM 436 TaxID=1192034 RepID=A0A017T2N3_9BACT|nr:3'-5' exonuclease [Chondromyces apiculatus]EYF03514.1 Exonuclease [Chondromyces apiculatus DSM 436]
MTSPDFTHYLVIDLEATCCDMHSFPRDEMEIIEIGAVLVDAVTLAPAREFQTFVRPVLHPRLTEFCTGLTSITQADVDAAPRFPSAVARLKEFVRGTNARFCSWGRYDKNQLERDAHRHHAQLPLSSTHLNLKERFSQQLGEARAYGVGQALRRVGIRFEGTQHRAIDDARNIARLLPYALGRASPRQQAAPLPPRPGPAR